MQCHRWLLLLGSLLGVSACAGTPAPGLSYSVAIDPAFTTDQTEAITAGIESWVASVPELHVTYAIATCKSPDPDQVCMHPDAAPPDMSDDIVGDTQPTGDDGSAVLLYVDRVEAAFPRDPMKMLQQTATHEMGHALGLKHSATGTLMAADVQNQASTITPADIAQFWSVRGK